jgi:hypothetical protein
MRSRSLISALALTGVMILVPAAGWAGPGSVGPLQQVSGASPFGACTADNVAAQPGTLFPNSELEPQIAGSAVDRNGDGAPDLVAAYQQDRWSNGGSRGLYASVWFRGAWTQVAIPGTSACVGGTHLRASDPWVSFSPDGTLYYLTLATSAGNDSEILVNRSTDGGLHWSAPVSLINDNSPFTFDDKNSITADPTDSRFVYAIWDRGNFPSDTRELHSVAGTPKSLRSDAMLARSTDGGATWEAARAIFAPQASQFGIGHQIVVLADGTLVDGFMLFHGSGSNKKGQEVAVMVSHDHGVTWTAPITVAKVLPGFVSDPDDGTPLRTGDIIPEIAAGPNGTVYMTWQDATLAPSASAIAFAKSLDGGLTWSTPVAINKAPTAQAFTPSIRVLPDGTIGVTHYDLRFNTADGGATLPTDYWFLHSHDGGATWTEARVTNASFDMRKAPDAEGLFTGDYEGLTVQSGAFVAAFDQTHGTDPGSIFVTRLTG